MHLRVENMLFFIYKNTTETHCRAGMQVGIDDLCCTLKSSVKCRRLIFMNLLAEDPESEHMRVKICF